MIDQDPLVAIFLTHSSGPISEPSKTETEKKIDSAQETMKRWRWTEKIGEEPSPLKKRKEQNNNICNK